MKNSLQNYKLFLRLMFLKSHKIIILTIFNHNQFKAYLFHDKNSPPTNIMIRGPFEFSFSMYYLINRSSRYLGSGQISLSTISSRASMSFLISSIRGATLS